MALKLFFHALRMLTGNAPETLRLGGLVLIANLVVLALIGEDYFAVQTARNPPTSSIVNGLWHFVAQVVVGVWVAVAWHRFILLEEVPGAVPPVNLAAIWRYVGAAVVTLLVIFAVVVPLAIIGALLGTSLMPASTFEPGLSLAVLSYAVIALPITYLCFRFAPLLPSAALGPRMALRDAWYATGAAGMAFVWLSVIVLIVEFAAQEIPNLFAATALPLAVVLAALGNTVILMLGISLLTTIHGHYVQERPLDA